MPRDFESEPENYIKTRLELAGKTIMMLPDKVRPTGYISNWPQHLREYLDTLEVVEEILDGKKTLTLKVIEATNAKPVLRASLQQINEMNEVIYGWMPRLASHCLARKIPYVARCTALAMLHYPDTGRRVWTYRKLGKLFHCNHQTAANWYEDGINILTRKIVLDKIV